MSGEGELSLQLAPNVIVIYNAIKYVMVNQSNKSIYIQKQIKPNKEFALFRFFGFLWSLRTRFRVVALLNKNVTALSL